MTCEDCIANLGSPEAAAHLESCPSCAELAHTAKALALPPVSAAEMRALEALPIPEAIIVRTPSRFSRFAGYAIAASIGAFCVFAAERSFTKAPIPPTATAAVCPADSAADDDFSDDWGFSDLTWLTKLDNSYDESETS